MEGGLEPMLRIFVQHLSTVAPAAIPIEAPLPF